ncbi:MAG: Peptidoglycan-binding lysin domain protein [Myxococcales bacterium]|nr:Peptidoglycan-binding lysin domain protein [Myxococcales bacterium]
MKRCLVLFGVLVPSLASAQQVPFYPSGLAPAPPVTLDPGASGTQAPPPPPPRPTAAPSSQPNVVVVKPDGTMTFGGDQPQTEKGFYVNGGEPAAPANDNEVHAGPVPELHVVRSGDTLWDICWFYFNDPWQWPKVWSYNPQITNPHWIYPGDLVRLLPRGLFVQGPEVKEPEQGAVASRPVENLPAPQRNLQVGLKQTAFVEKADLDKSIVIDGAVDEKTLLGNGDSVYLAYPPGKPPQVGQKYSVYQPDNEVQSNGKPVGAYVKILGTVEVVSVKQDKRARGVISEAAQEIERGAKVGPLVRQYKTVPPVAPKVDAQGTIVARLQNAQIIGQGELVFIDLGTSSGIEVGNRMFVVRRGDAKPLIMDNRIGQDDRRFPARALGEIVVVEVGKNISVGLVTLSVQEMGIGDIVMMQKSK